MQQTLAQSMAPNFCKRGAGREFYYKTGRGEGEEGLV